MVCEFDSANVAWLVSGAVSVLRGAGVFEWAALASLSPGAAQASGRCIAIVGLGTAQAPGPAGARHFHHHLPVRGASLRAGPVKAVFRRNTASTAGGSAGGLHGLVRGGA